VVKKPKAKGNKFENEILMQCKEIDPKAHKTLGSGNSDKDKGDIVFLHFLIECKHMKDYTDTTLHNFFRKVKQEAEDRGMWPLLVFRRNHRRTMVMWEDALTDNSLFMYWDEFLEDYT
jgi:hypothetical protein